MPRDHLHRTIPAAKNLRAEEVPALPRGVARGERCLGTQQGLRGSDRTGRSLGDWGPFTSFCNPHSI